MLMTMFWKKVKLVDQKKVCHKIKTSQPIAPRIVITIGMIGFGSFQLIATTYLAML